MTWAWRHFFAQSLKAGLGWVLCTESIVCQSGKALATIYCQPSFSPAEETDILRLSDLPKVTQPVQGQD